MARLVFENYDPNSNGYYNTTVVNGENLPPGGKPGQILVKTGYADFDCDWMTVYVETDDTGGSGGTGTGGDITLDSVAPIRVQGGGSAWTISIDAASQLRPGSMSAADKRRLDNLPCWVSATEPTLARVNDFWWNTEDGTLYILYQDKNSTQWVPATPSGGGQGQSVYVGSVPPTAPSQGSLWWNTEDGTGYIWYADGDSAAWVPFTPAGGGQSQGIYFGDVPPSDPTAWGGWFDTTIGTTFLWFDDGNSAQWVPASPQGGGQNEANDEGVYA
jgi:hypothetical protein